MSPSNNSAQHLLVELFELAARHERLDRATAASLRDAAHAGALSPDAELECNLLTRHLFLGKLLPTALEALEEGGVNGFSPHGPGGWAVVLRTRASELKAADEGDENSGKRLAWEAARIARSLGELDDLLDGALTKANQRVVADPAVTRSCLQPAERAIADELLFQPLLRVIQASPKATLFYWPLIPDTITKAVLLAFLGDDDALDRCRRAARQVVPGGPAGHTGAEVELYEREVEKAFAETLRHGLPLLERGRSLLNELLREMADRVVGRREHFYGMRPHELLDPAAHARLRASKPTS